MTTIRTRTKVAADGNVVIPVGSSEAGVEVEVLLTPILEADSMSTGSRVDLPADQWLKDFLELEGSISDPNFCRPPQPPLKPAPDFD